MCSICDDSGIDFYQIMKKFCSDMDAIREDICENHVERFNELRLEFLNKKGTGQ